MFNCIKTSSFTGKEEYPVLCYPVTLVNYTNTMQFFGVYETEADAQQYIIDHTTDSKPLTYYLANFIPPASTSKLQSGPNYPNYVYPMTSKRPTDSHYIAQPQYVFANESDASDFVLSHSNKDINYMYSIQNWIAANTYDYQKHGFVGHKFFKHVAPTKIVVINNDETCSLACSPIMER